MRLYLWVENQPGDFDATDDYLAAAGATEALELPADEQGWALFLELREAVAWVGHGDVEESLDEEIGAPSLVAALTKDDGAARDLQYVVSRTARTYAEFVREALVEA